VRTEGDGSLRVEVPNERYDEAVARAKANDPSFDSRSAAGSLEAGLSNAAAGRGNGIAVTRATVPGGSTSSVRPGQTVIFSVTADPAVAPSFRTGAVQVRLDDAGRPVGYMTVQDAFLDAGSRQGAVGATLPPGLVSSSGVLQATVTCAGASSNAVPIGVAAETEVIAQATALSGTAAQVKLVNRTGGRIKGVLEISGPGTFPDGGRLMRFDAWSTATALVLTTDPGAVVLTFKPDADAGTAGAEKLFG
ncbi:MAG: hypothetical protein MUC63_02470, partial [Planctomycetes bacterium]|nr:hypothetical protein [Planctomycetota bacterium]